ncbi:hypothetical protein H8744_08020 [Oscillospiraceae bacterium N12]|jgi:hypothetical protein|uniref:BACON domain-containing protein n=1 Tax=Jilunia laotingensis TaxID=2763675 RepID=A0A926F305_9BACT|nr:BACON domain-containing carbohydrate-binding protein [Jilunia laotingensis]MBC8593198.1 hypothetical protein [Jilunia laotingensis]
MKNKILLASVFNLFLILFIVHGCSLEEASFTCEIKGTVYKTDGLPLEGAKLELRLADSKLETQTESDGSFIFKNVEPGLGVLISKKEEYISQKTNLFLKGKHTEHYDITLYSIAEQSFLKLNEGERIIENQDTIINISVESNVDYYLSANTDWITIPSNSFSGSNIVTLKIKENDTYLERTAEIIFKGEYDVNSKFIVTQKAGPALKLVYSENTDNPVLAQKEGVFFHFNRSVKIVKLTSTSQPSSELTVNLLNQGETVHIIGIKVPPFKESSFKLVVQATDCTQRSIPLDLKGYIARTTSIDCPTYMLFTDNTHCLAYSSSTWQIIDLPQMTPIITIPNSYLYSMPSYNTNNKMIYAIRMKGYTNYYADLYHAISGNFVEEVPLNFNSSNGLRAMIFGDNGIGLCLTNNRIYSINSHQNHQIELIPGYDITKNPHQIESLLVSNVETCDNGNGFILYGNNPINMVAYVDAATLEIKKVCNATSENYCGVSPRTPFVAISNPNSLQLINIISGTKTNFKTPSTDYNTIKLLDNGTEVTHILFIAYEKIYILQCSNNQTQEIDMRGGVWMSSSLDSQNAIFMFEVGQNCEYYLIDTNLLKLAQ